MVNTYEFELNVNSEIDEVLAKLKRYGIAIIRKYVSENQLNDLNNEYSSILAEDLSTDGILRIEQYETNPGFCVRVKREKLPDDKYPVVKQVFGASFMDEITKKYYLGQDYLLNDDIFVSRELPGDVPILDWHFDRVQSLKFYINLVDVDESNGALEYVPGSHREGNFRANYHLLAGGSVANIPNQLPHEEIHNPVTIAVNAGDLVIFDPDGFHRGGIVREGKERRIMRGHAHIYPMSGFGKPGRFSAKWWMQSPLNIAKIAKSKVIRASTLSTSRSERVKDV